MRYVACKKKDRERMKSTRKNMALGDKTVDKLREREKHPLSFQSQETQTPAEWETQAHSIISIAEAYKNLMPSSSFPEMHCGCKGLRHGNIINGKSKFVRINML